MSNFFNMRLLLLKIIPFFTFLFIYIALFTGSVNAKLPADGNLGGGESSTNNSTGVGVIDDNKLGVPNDINGVIGGLVQLVYAIAGITFFVMGILILGVALTNRLFMQAGGYGTSINIYLTKILQSINGIVQAMPEYIWALLLIVIIGGIVWRVVRQFDKEKYEEK